MNHDSSPAKLTLCCPSGHRLRGGNELLGQTVTCPKCHCSFVFSPPPAETSRAVTDTGVMKILGDFSSADTPDSQPPAQTSLRPCPKCQVPIAETLAVCNHCNCYVGVMPSFLQSLHDHRRSNV